MALTRSRALPLLLLALLLANPAEAAAPAAHALKAGVLEPARAAPDFALRGSDGSELTLSRFRGKVVLLVFGFTRCPEVCPTTLATLAQARKDLGADAAAVQVVYLTVDPERDDLGRMKSYLAAFDASFVGGTGQPEALAALRKGYGVVAEKVPLAGGGYAMNHSTSVYLIDRTGRLRAMMPYGHEAKDFVHDVALLLAAR
jgi:protein SCO1/2